MYTEHWKFTKCIKLRPASRPPASKSTFYTFLYMFNVFYTCFIHFYTFPMFCIHFYTFFIYFLYIFIHFQCSGNILRKTIHFSAIFQYFCSRASKMLPEPWKCIKMYKTYKKRWKCINDGSEKLNSRLKNIAARWRQRVHKLTDV